MSILWNFCQSIEFIGRWIFLMVGFADHRMSFGCLIFCSFVFIYLLVRYLSFVLCTHVGFFLFLSRISFDCNEYPCLPLFPYNSFYTRWVRAVRCIKFELWNFLSVFRHRAQKSTDFYRANNFSYYTPLDYNNVQRILCAPVLPFNALGFGLMYEENDRKHTLTRKMYTLFGKILYCSVRLCLYSIYLSTQYSAVFFFFSHFSFAFGVVFNMWKYNFHYTRFFGV